MQQKYIQSMVILTIAPTLALGATVPIGFSDEAFVSGLSRPIAMAFAADGRLFVAEQDGKLRVIKSGALRATPFVSLTVATSGERGLLGLAFDPDFATNRHLYLHYTVPDAHNRISRFTASGDVAVAGSERVLLDLSPLSTKTIHNGGAMHFGADGKLYIAVGDNGDGTNAQSLSTHKGKLLRINRDGTIPDDNPSAFQSIAGAPAGLNRAIWAAGLRNPFTFSVEPGSGKIFLNDVGELTWEEIDIGRAGANYGWPLVEGPSADTGLTGPIFSYGHDASATPSGCAITGGTFYSPSTPSFPAAYVGKYYFSDYCGGWIAYIDSANPGTATEFATGLGAVIDLDVGPEGALYYLMRDTGSVRRIRHTGQAQQALRLSASRLTVVEGADNTVTVALLQAPASDLVVSIAKTLNDPSVGFSPGSLRFTPLNWDVPQAVLVSAGQDSDRIDDGATLRFSAPELPARQIAITTIDNDRPPGAPRALITLPQNGDTVSGRTAEFFGDGIDNRGAVKAKFYVDGILKSTDRNTLNHYHYLGNHNQWDTSGLSIGVHTLKMRVDDADGLSASHEIKVWIAR